MNMHPRFPASSSINVRELTVALVSGTGRMGVHLSAAWAHAGMDVLLCSRDKDRATPIVESLLSGRGYSVGDMMVPAHPSNLPPPSETWRLRAGNISDAAQADVIVLASPFHVMWQTLKPLVPMIRGKGTVFMDLTNPWLNTSAPRNADGSVSSPIPLDEPQASVLYHKVRVDDPTTAWCHAYRHVFWMLIHPTGPNPRCGHRKGIELLGDPRAVDIGAAIIRSHGFDPVIRSGGCEVAPQYEVSFTGRVTQGPNTPPAAGSDPDGLIGPFSASPMLAFDTLKEKLLRRFRCA